MVNRVKLIKLSKHCTSKDAGGSGDLLFPLLHPIGYLTPLPSGQLVALGESDLLGWLEIWHDLFQPLDFGSVIHGFASSILS